MRLWVTAGLLFLVWFILKVLLHKEGMVHVILLAAIAVFVVQLAAHRKARHHKSAAGS